MFLKQKTMGKHSKKSKKIQTKKEKIKEKETKKYELKPFTKRDSQLSHSLYDLPLPIKIIIYRIAITTNMLQWKKEHKEKMNGWYDNPVNWFKSPGTLDLIKGWGAQRPEPCYFGNEESRWSMNEFRGRIPSKYKVNLCAKGKITYKKDGKRYYDMTKIDIYSLPTDLCRQLYRINETEIKVIQSMSNGESTNFWVGCKCRCISCDLIRQTYFKYSLSSREKYIEKNTVYNDKGKPIKSLIKPWGNTYSHVKYCQYSHEKGFNYGMRQIAGYWKKEE